MEAAPQSMVQLLRLEDDAAHRQLLEALNGVTENEAWAVPTLEGRDYLHTDGSILSIAQHIAGAEVMYASAAFREGEVRWSEVALRLDEIGADWEQNLAYLVEAHAYWLASWKDLQDAELSLPRKTNWGDDWPAWRVLTCMAQHAAYHAGQIAVMRALLAPAEAPPPLTCADEIRQYCKDSPFW
jgi:uncharacterized damage-inducible protein DinB